jgi:hypothetical protein
VIAAAPPFPPAEIVSACFNFSWPTYGLPALCEGSVVRFPAIASPLFATLLHLQFFTKLPASDHVACLLVVNSLLSDFSACLRPIDAFALGVVLSELARTHPNLDSGRVSSFLQSLKPMLAISAQRILAPIISASNEMITFFGKGFFCIERLVDDGKAFLANLDKQGGISPQTNRLLVDFGLSIFEHRLILSILNSPLTFLRGIHWKSFITAIESESGLEFPTLHQIAIAVNLAHQIAKQPAIGGEVCSLIPSSTIAFILKNFLPDETLPMRLDSSGYLKANWLVEVPQTVARDTPTFPDVIVTDVNVQQWRKIRPPSAALTQFPWLKV